MHSRHRPLATEYVEDLKYWCDSLIFAVRRDRPKVLREYRLRKVRPRIKELYRRVVELHALELREGRPATSSTRS